jgi:N-hydroxyarylamine O-acetyltransferase
MPAPDLDLDAYLARISYSGPRDNSLAVLRDLVSHHTTAISFENLDVVAGRPVELDLAALQRKLVQQARGGYCFEQNALFLAALRALGFGAAGLIGHVRLGIPAAIEMPRTHMVLHVELPEGAYIADVGFGGLTPTAPLALRTDIDQPTPHEVYRLVETGAEFTLRAQVNGDWRDVYCFSLQRQRPIDYEVANWFTATNPKGPFINNVIATRAVPGERRTLFNWRFTRRRTGQAPEAQLVASADDYQRVLREEFGLAPDHEALRATLAAVQRHAPDAPPPGPFA